MLDAEHALLQLQAEEATVGDAQGRALCLVEVVGEHGLGAVPRSAAPPELSDVVEAPACSARWSTTRSFMHRLLSRYQVLDFGMKRVAYCVTRSRGLEYGSYS